MPDIKQRIKEREKMSSSKYVDRVQKDTIAKNADQKEFIQAVEEVLTSLTPVLKANPQYE